jgi:FlgD Ig-like domain
MPVPNPASFRAATRTWRWPSVLAFVAIIGLLAGLVVVPASHGAEDDLQLYPLASSNFGRVLRVSGIANPGQAVRIEANGQVVARTVANESGDFAVAFTPVRGMNTVQAVEDGRFHPARSAAFRVRQDMPRILERPVAVSRPATASGTSTRNIVMKVTLAAPVITTPPATTTANPITLSGTAPASSTVNFYVNGRYTRAVTATAGGTFSTWVPLEDSLNSVYAVATSGLDTSPASNTVQTTYTNSIARTYAAGTISVPTVWTAGSAPTYTINGTQTISNTGALWIQPGVTVSVTGNYKLVTNGGEIAIRGTSTARVTLRPSTALCTGTSAQRNDWSGIEATNSTGSGTISTEYADVYCAANGVFFNGGTGSTRYSRFLNNINGLQTKGGSASAIIVPLISGNNEFQGNTKGILVATDSRPTISGSNVFTNNSEGIRVTGNATAANNPLPVINGNSFYGNSTFNLYTENFNNNNTVVLDATGNWWGSADPGVIIGTIRERSASTFSPYVNYAGFLNAAGGSAAYTGSTLVGPVTATSTLAAGDYLMLSDIPVSSGVTWTIASGTVIRSVAARRIVVSGTLQASGTSTQRIRFTSAGDFPAKSDWGGIEVATGGTATLSYARIEYASKGVFFNSGQGTVTHSLIRFCDSGIHVAKLSNPTINLGNEISNNTYGIYADAAGAGTSANNPQPVVNGNSLFANASYNVYTVNYVAPKQTLNGTGNWWGSAVAANIAATINTTPSTATTVDTSGYLTTEPFPPAINLTNFALSVREVRPIVSTTPASGTFTLNRGGTVTFQIKRDSDGVVVRQWSQSFVAGSNAFSWDGRNDAAQLIPQGAYRAVLTATDGLDPFVYDAPVPAVVVGNTGGVGSPPATFSPYTGEQYKLNVTFQSPTLASLLITPQSGTPFYVFQNVYYPAGSNWVYWDGRDPNGVLLTVPATVWVDDGQIMRTNGIYVFSPIVQITGTTAAPNIEVRSDPYLITSSYEQNAKIVYRISLDATVRVTLLPPGIVDPASPSAIVLVNNVSQSAKDGSNVPIDYTVEWRGYNTADPNAVLVSTEGAYTFAIEATLPATGQKTLYRGILNIAQ